MAYRSEYGVLSILPMQSFERYNRAKDIGVLVDLGIRIIQSIKELI